jgi:hypothetical protein
MPHIRVLVGTRKGAFILSSDAAHRDWQVAGPFFVGWEIFHIAASPANQDRLYASQSSSWFGQVIQRSDGGRETNGHTPGTVMLVAFELDGQPYAALSGGPQVRFDEAVTFFIDCASQAEVDHYGGGARCRRAARYDSPAESGSNVVR